MAIPFIHCNMGGEMVYILEQRLYSQKIRKDKIERVLTDIIKQLYNPKVFRELLKPGPLPSNTYMKGIFHTIANTSIMKLSEQSMEKMYELMVMGFKYQVVNLTHPKDLIAVTLNHIEASRLLTEPESHARLVIDSALIQLEDTMRKISVAQFHGIRGLLCKFFQDRRTKVSLFLRENLQTERGNFPLEVGGPMPNDELVETPGVVRYFTQGSDPLVEVFEHPLTWKITNQRKSDHFNYKLRDITYGTNLYISQTDDQRIAAMESLGKPVSKDGSDPSPSITPSRKSESETTNRDDQHAYHDANFLQMFLGKTATDTGFKFSPFGENQANNSGDGNGEEIEIQGMSRERYVEINSELAAMMDELEVIDKVYNNGGEEKLLGSCSSLLDLLRDQGLA
eukprot:TRINITY_DN19176_c0_g1_i1.p1 TRINITY_DN19176_c0_g1~~TRINITY_DN19176_c0_g1_i1.p1  ORF type:complete len:396 (+),score=72.78 TRINITY_DN19176_c0_g1_i1:100-1287(+)